MSALENLIERWRSTAGQVRHGVSESELLRFEAENSVSLPGEIADFYRRVDGQDENTFDPISKIRIWPLHSVRLSSHPHIYIFADYLIESHWYGFELSEQEGHPTVYLVGSDTPQAIADSFSAFLALVYEGSRNLFA